MNDCDALKVWELETRIKELEGNNLNALISQFNDNIDKITNKTCEKLDDIRPNQHKPRRKPTIDEINRELLADCARRQAAVCGMANQDRGLQGFYRQERNMGFNTGMLGALAFYWF